MYLVRKVIAKKGCIYKRNVQWLSYVASVRAFMGVGHIVFHGPMVLWSRSFGFRKEGAILEWFRCAFMYLLCLKGKCCWDVGIVCDIHGIESCYFIVLFFFLCF